MTKKERATVQGFINKLTELSIIEEETLKALQDLNVVYGDGSRWCSWEACLEGILKNTETDDRTKAQAKYQYTRFVKAAAQEDLISDFAGELADIGFWK